MRAEAAIVALACVLAAPGCARRAMPYHFRAPVVAGVRAADVPRPVVRVAEPGAESFAPPEPAAERPSRRRDRPTAATARPSPFRPFDDPSSRPIPVSPAVAKLYALVGEHDKQATDIQLALRALAALGVRPSPALAGVASGEALLELARQRKAYPGDGPPLIGDLVVFDAVQGDRPASLVGVVVGVRGDRTVEFIYLARGVVRRGWLNTAEPSRQRDDNGRILNSFVRHSDGRDPQSARYLAGELLGGFVRIDRLAER